MAFALMPITFRSSTSEAPEAEAVAPEMQAFEGTGHRNRWRPGINGERRRSPKCDACQKQGTACGGSSVRREERLHQPRFSRPHLQEFDRRFAIPGRRSKDRSIRILLVVPTVSEPRSRACLTTMRSRTPRLEMAVSSSCSSRIPVTLLWKVSTRGTDPAR